MQYLLVGCDVVFPKPSIFLPVGPIIAAILHTNKFTCIVIFTTKRDRLQSLYKANHSPVIHILNTVLASDWLLPDSLYC